MNEQMVQDKAEVQGTYDDRFRAVYDVLERQLNNGDDIGSAAAVFIDGEPVVDIWGGYIDEARTRPWERDTIVNTFSTTKPMTALCALILADRGEFDLQAPVTKYSPEFGAAGKGDTKVSHLLAHTSGLPGWTETVTLDDILDREKAADLLARQAPWWEPGTAIGYNPITYGPLIGEVIRRVSGKTLKQFFAEDVAGPLGADYHIGAEPEHDHRVSPLFPGAPPRQLGDTQSMTSRWCRRRRRHHRLGVATTLGAGARVGTHRPSSTRERGLTPIRSWVPMIAVVSPSRTSTSSTAWRLRRRREKATEASGSSCGRKLA
jgi:CubicO group peptidase (beta-lactamase class C family)